MRTSLLVLGVLLLCSVALSQDVCKMINTCDNCIKNNCTFCPGSQTSSPFCASSTAASPCGSPIIDIGKCPPPPCGNRTCGESQFCDTSNPNNLICKCRECKKMVDGKCTLDSLCDFNTQVCSLNKCVCKPGFALDTTSLKCVKVSCGNYLAGCGPNSECKNDDCVCKEGYVPANSTDALLKPGCVLPPKTCQDTCTGPNQQCYDNICGCVSGYYFSNRTCVVVPTEENPVDCSSFKDCGSCNKNLACGFCFNKETKVGKCIFLKNSTCVSGEALVSQIEQCSCISGCSGGQVCTANGCACNSPLQYIDGRCVDTSNPCANTVCKENESCENIQTTSGLRPVCRCKEGMIRDTSGNCVAITQCKDSTACNCFTFPTGSVCCPSPLVPHLAEGETVTDPLSVCKFKCPDGTFVSKIESCACISPYVRDLVTNICSPPCPNGESPKEGRCGTVSCESGQSANPDYPIKSDVPCGYTCLDGKFVLSKSICEEGCKVETPPSYCPCPSGQKRDPATGKCVTPCTNGAFPIDGKCPTLNNCKEGFPIEYKGEKVCGRQCKTGELLPNYIPCPSPPCSDGLVYDVVSEVCVNPCANGAPPRGGVCNQCTKPEDCCQVGLEGSDVCGYAGCEDGMVRNAKGECVKPCSDGSLPIDGIGCPTGDQCKPGFFFINNQCVTYCPGTNVTTNDPRTCCPEGQYMSPTDKRCLCKDGTVAVNGVCNIDIKCDPFVNEKCPCIFPLVRNSNKKCACPDEVNYPNPYDGSNCGYNPCGRGLVKNEGGSCVCPLTGKLPETILKEGKNITICKCDPAIHSGCPLTPSNCEGSTYKPCLCILDNQNCEDDSESPSKERCEVDRTSKECFCLANPNAEDCSAPPLCTINPDHPDCVSKDNCTAQNYKAGFCTVYQYCEKHPNEKACKCLQPGSCSRESLRISENKTIIDLIQANCTEADKSNKNKIECFCKFNFHPLCTCVIEPSKEGCSSPDGSGEIPIPEASSDDECKIITGKGKSCSRTSSKTESDEDLKFNNAEVTEEIKDSIIVQIKKTGNPGLLYLERDATPGSNTGGKVDSSGIKVKVGLVVSKCFEYLDVNLDGIFGDGDMPVKEIYFRDLEWTVDQTTNEYGFTTITLSAMDGKIVITYVISTKEVTIDGVVRKARTNKMSLDVEFPFEKLDGKLGCQFKILTKVHLNENNNNTVSVDGDKATLIFELNSQAGNTDVEVVQVGPTETTEEDDDFKEEDDDLVYTVNLYPSVFAPSSWHYDPEVSTSDTAPTYTTPTLSPTLSPTNTPSEEPDSAISVAISWAALFLSFVLFLFF